VPTSTTYFNEEIILTRIFLKYIDQNFILIFLRRVDLIRFPTIISTNSFEISNQEKDEIELVAMRWQRRKKKLTLVPHYPKPFIMQRGSTSTYVLHRISGPHNTLNVSYPFVTSNTTTTHNHVSLHFP